MYRLTESNAVIRIADGAIVPADPANADRQGYLAWLAAGNTPEPAPEPTPEQVAASMSGAAQARIDAFAGTKRYDGVNSASKYLNITDDEIAALPAEDQEIVRRYRAEARYLVVATAQTWAAMERVENEVKAGTRPMPTNFADLEPELPVLEWPQ